ncbi:PH domain-containing protein [Holdemanella biformis]
MIVHKYLQKHIPINNWPIIRNDNRPHISTCMSTKKIQIFHKKRGAHFLCSPQRRHFLT